MSFRPPPQVGNKDKVIDWLREFEKEYGYANVAEKWTKGNIKALWNLEKEELKKKLGSEEGSLIYEAIHGEGKNICELKCTHSYFFFAFNLFDLAYFVYSDCCFIQLLCQLCIHCDQHSFW